MGRFEWIIVVVTCGLVFWGCESGGPTAENGGGGGGPFPSLVGEWVWQHPLPQGNDLLAVDFVDANLGLAVGAGGAIIRTTNGGATWDAIAPVTNYTVTDVKFLTSQTAFAVGYEPLLALPVVLRSTDGGLNWSVTQLSGNGTVEALAVGSADVIYLGGEALDGDAYFSRTTDGGDSWNSVNTNVHAGIKGLKFLEEAYGVAAGTDGRIYVTLNGGDDWAQAAGSNADPFSDVSFLGISVGWATVGPDYPTSASHDQLFFSGNSGQAWTGVDLQENLSLQSVSTPTFSVIAAGGYQVQSGVSIVPIFLYSNDAGAHWTLTQLHGIAPGVTMVSDVDFINSVEGWLVGPSNFIAHTDQAGNPLEIQSQIGVSDWELTDVEFMTNDEGWAVGATGGDSALVLTTTNGGQSWTLRNTPVPYPFHALSFAGTSSAWAVSQDGLIFRSPLSGVSWAVVPSASSEDLNDLHFKDAITGWVVGDMGTLMSTSDGLIWTTVDLGITENLTCIEFATDSVGYVAGDNGAFFRTTNGGGTWSSLDAPTSYDFVALTFVNADTGWAATQGGQVLRTIEGGTNFVSLANLGSGMIRDIEFINDIYGFICGPDGRIWSTSDRGNLWESEITGTDLDLNRLHFRSNSEGWVVGKGSAILHRAP